MKNGWRILFFGLLLQLSTVTGLVAETEVSNEHGKINTADPSVIEPGTFELEFGYSYTRAKKIWDTESKSEPRGLLEELSTGLTLTYGAGKDLDFTIALDYLWVYDRDNQGPVRGNSIGDLRIGGRYRFLHREKENLELAFLSALTIPTGKRSRFDCLGTSQEFWCWENALVLSKDWDRWTVNSELGYALPLWEKKEGFNGVLCWSLALGYQLFPWLQPEMELNYLRDFVSEGEAGQVLALTAGLVMPVNERLRVNLGLQQGIWGRNAEQATVVLLAVKTAF
ncbi:MAG: transporter [Thermodesulfobacteriota bacterium]